jgi:hypothetical protein
VFKTGVVRIAAVFLVVLGTLVVAAPALAAPPANDAFANAQALGPAGSLTATNVEATKEPGEPNHADNAGGRSVWFRWTPGFSGQARVATCGTSTTFDTLLAVYIGSNVAALGAVAASDDSCGDRSEAVFTVVAGTTYNVAVDGFNGASGAFTLSWGPVLPPPNDSFAAAQALSGLRGSLDGTILGATREPGEPRHGSSSPYGSVWYAWTAGLTGAVGFDTCRGAAFDSVLAAYTGAVVSSLTALSANDDSCRVFSRVRFPVRAGSTYVVAVDGEAALGEARGAFTLSWQAAATPRNDRFAAAQRIRGIRGTARGTNVGATSERGERTHLRNPPGASMWYRWRAPRTMRVVFDTCRSGFDTVLAVYRGSSVARAKLVRANDDACGTRSRVTVRVTGGVEYRVVVDGFRLSTGSFALRWARAR